MFDTIHPVSKVYETRTVHEHRAPTDESVRLLREMESKAESHVLKAVRVQNTDIDAVLHHCRDHLTDDLRVACIFKVNGKQHRADFRGRGDLTIDEIAVGVRDTITQEIANLITNQVFAATRNLFPHWFTKT